VPGGTPVDALLTSQFGAGSYPQNGHGDPPPEIIAFGVSGKPVDG
jgi:hypothetical protein